MSKALNQARDARLFILDKMNDALGQPREDISQYAPRIISIMIDKDKIRDVIGPGGKMIRSITERTGCKIEIQDDGRIDIASTSEESAQKAVTIIKELTAEAELGKIYVGKVVRVVNFGAFVEILPGVEGLLHISEIEDHRINEVRDVLDEGDETMVKVIDIDAQRRVRLSRRAAMRDQKGEGDDSKGQEPVAAGDRERSERRPRPDGDRGPRRGPGGGNRGDKR
jgi:polyribonucleotide nucleotidyltransferase